MAQLTAKRREGLKKNFQRMFFISAFLNVQMLNIVWSLFFLHRGLTLSQVFYLSVVFAVGGLVSEVPSSYAADRWGRKKTLVVSTLLFAAYSAVFLFAHSFWLFALGIALYSVSFSFRTGTDDALIYDTNRELGESGKSLVKLGNYYAAQHVFKIVAPVLGALIAVSLTDVQFQMLIGVNLIGALIACGFALSLVEPHHKMDVAKQEAGILVDAARLFRKNPLLLRSILNRTTLFIVTFIPWLYHQQFLIDRGLTVLTIGIAWGVMNLLSFVTMRNIRLFAPRHSVATRINALNLIILTSLLLLLGALFVWPNPYALLVLIMIFFKAETLRWPLFAEYYNNHSFSYNRATTLSLSNLLKSVLDVPLLLVSSYLVQLNPIYPFIFCAALCVFVVALLPLKQYHTSVD